ncbi:circadian clock protein KaiB [Gammaproteobacteria bacterium]
MTADSTKPLDRSAEFESALAEAAEAGDAQCYILRLYVAGLSPRSQQALSNIKKVCEEHLAGRYELEVIDIYRKPTLAVDEQIMAVPTLLKQFPPPLRRVIGDLSNQEMLLFGLDLKPREPPRGG